MDVNRLNDDKINSEMQKDINQLKNVSKRTLEQIYGIDSSFDLENKKDYLKIATTLNKIKGNYTKSTGDNLIEFFNRLNHEKSTSGSKSKRYKDSEMEKTIKGLENQLNDPDNPFVSELFSAEEGRFNLYQNYELIYEYIPQMAQALDTYVDNIISPDDFTKDIFNIFFDGESVSNTSSSTMENDRRRVIRNLKNIEREYRIEEKASDIIRETLKLGEQFVAVLRIDDELNKMLTETNAIDPNSGIFNEGNKLSYNNVDIDDEVYKILEESNIFTDKKKVDKDDYKEKIAQIVNENIQFTTNHNSILHENYMYKNDFGKDIEKVFTPGMTSDDVSSKKRKASKDRLQMSGSIMKILDPNKVIKIEVDQINYGYYYIESTPEDIDGKYDIERPSINRLGSLSPTGPNVSSDKTMNMWGNQSDLKMQMVTELFIKNISHKLDKDFIRKNDDFKKVIYEFVKTGYLINNAIRITYIAPEDMVHFNVHKDMVYGNSLYRKVLFISKLYLAVLTSTLMSKLTRSNDKRIIYVETALDNNVEGSIQQVVRDIKSKEIKMENFKDINTILSTPGQNNDYYIPTINGEKPIEFDTLNGMDVNMDNDFLEYLLKSMISGIGIPPDFLSYSEQTEFSRSLAMQNGKFIRSIVHYQKVLGSQFTELYQKLYINEYGMEDEDTKSKNSSSRAKITKGKKKKNNKKEYNNDSDVNSSIPYEKITVSFPSPAALNMSNMSEQINNSRDIIDFITNTLVQESGGEDLEAYKHFVKKNIAMDLVPSIDWDRYTELLKSAEIEFNKDKLTNDDPEDDRGDGYF